MGALAAFLGCTMDMQLLVFSISTLVSLFLLRPILYNKDESKLKTNTEALIGREGIVTEKIDSLFASGRVSIDGDKWKAISENGIPIDLREKVLVTEINSTIITVKKI
jgi:membrane protein implicated in regulation of membrane protease activity